MLLKVEVVRALALLMPCLCGPGRLPAARGRAVALCVEPPGYLRLASDGRLSLTQHGPAGGAGWGTWRSRECAATYSARYCRSSRKLVTPGTFRSDSSWS